MGVVYIGIGSNVDRDQNIRSALSALSRLGSNLRISSVYESPAYGFTGENFYNLVTGFETSFSPQELSVKLGQIEDGLGRLRNVPRFSSRTLDLDLLLYDDLVIHEESLDLPRSDIESYAFVLCPLAEIAADTIHPEKGMKISKIWAEFDQTEQNIWKVELDLSR